MNFDVPMLWREPKDHQSDCYFCLCNISGFSGKGKKSIVYPDVESATKPIPHDYSISYPTPPATWSTDSSSDDNSTSNESHSSKAQSSDFELPDHSEPHLITQGELNDLMRDLNLTKAQSEILGSRLQQWNLLASDAKVTLCRTRFLI
jgi:hypothetical protein